MEGYFGLDCFAANTAQVLYCQNVADDLFQVVDVAADQQLAGSSSVTNVKSYSDVNGAFWSREEKKKMRFVFDL